MYILLGVFKSHSGPESEKKAKAKRNYKNT